MVLQIIIESHRFGPFMIAPRGSKISSTRRGLIVLAAPPLVRLPFGIPLESSS